MGANPAAVFLWITAPWLLLGGLTWGYWRLYQHIRRERFVREWSKRLDAS